MRIKTGIPIDPARFGFAPNASLSPVTGIASDSGEILPGDLFLALPGKKTDGARYIPDAFANGASCVLSHEAHPDPRILAVPDPLAVLTMVAGRYASAIHHTTVAVTGSYGKTTLRTALTSVLGSAFPVVSTEGNGNTDLAVALTLLSMAPGTRFLIAEIGMRGPGEISRLSRLVAPEVAAITAIGSAHVGLLGSVDRIRAAKCEIADGMPSDGTLFYPANDRLLGDAVSRLPVRACGVSTDPRFPGAYALSPTGYENGKPTVKLSGPETELQSVTIPSFDLPTLSTAAFCFAVCAKLGVDPSVMRNGLANLPTPPLRRQTETVKSATVILDCYNASPEPTAAALDDLARYAGRRLFLVLGDMLELGDDSEELHRAVGRRAAEISPAWLLCVGREAHAYGVGACDAGLPRQRIVSFAEDEMTTIASFLKREMQPGDVLFIKGSRALALERLLPYLKEADV